MVILLTKGAKAIVDDSDYEELSQFSWYLTTQGRAATAIPDGPYKQKQVLMHRYILDFPEYRVDHINRDPLDNRRSNLRSATAQQNNHNKPKQVNNTSGYIGVTRSRNRWKAYIHLDNHRIHLIETDTPEEAAYVRDQVALQLFGEFANTNFGL